MPAVKKQLTAPVTAELLSTLQVRFANNMHRHQGMVWESVREQLVTHPQKLWSLYQMEETGGAPDLVTLEDKNGLLTFYDCAKESPALRRSICYDHEALLARKNYPPANAAINMATDMGITILTEEQYRQLQNIEPFDCKTSSWIATPSPIRQLGGALFCDRRFNTVFVYHNGADSYYGSRGFRGALQIG